MDSSLRIGEHMVTAADAEIAPFLGKLKDKSGKQLLKCLLIHVGKPSFIAGHECQLPLI